MNNGKVNLKKFLFLDDLKQKRKKEIICEIFGTGKSMIPNPVLHDLTIPHTFEKCVSFVKCDLIFEKKEGSRISFA